MDKCAFLFAGQGSQYIGMGKDLYESFPASRQIFDRAEEVLGFDLKRRVFEGPQELLRMTSVSQPAILTVSLACYEAFKSSDICPLSSVQYTAGLSLGEYTALIAAGSISFKDGILLVRKRGELMEEAATKHPGKMAAVLDLSLDALKEICAKTHAEIANLNCPGQVVISGKAEAVDKAMELCVQAQAKRVIPLEVSGGFHSSLMKEASVEFSKVLDTVEILPAKIPVVSNYTASVQAQPGEIKANLVAQMYSSVRWEESMRFMIAEGVSKFYEFGPGKVLKGLARKIDAQANVLNIEKRDDVINLQKDEVK
ncbi:MAG: ACP S-malonyltransferase [Candidatus Omnitrophica bacterium]|jgi:[acyl-carrier-protein] S-malonyltransferase|nr:ACP S-malonyltransferase [Candidatus Omnitrophota bacterium]